MIEPFYAHANEALALTWPRLPLRPENISCRVKPAHSRAIPALFKQVIVAYMWHTALLENVMSNVVRLTKRYGIVQRPKHQLGWGSMQPV